MLVLKGDSGDHHVTSDFNKFNALVRKRISESYFIIDLCSTFFFENL